MRIKQQNDIKDCGLVVIQAIHNFYYDRWIDINELKYKTNYGTKGINLYALSNLAQKYGIIFETYNGDFNVFVSQKIEKPIITILKNQDEMHYVIIYKRIKDYYYISDPLKGKIKLHINELKSLYANIVITIEKYPYKMEQSLITNNINSIFSYPKISLLILFSIFLSLIFNIFINSLMKILIDNFLSISKDETIQWILLLYGGVTIFHMINSWLQKIFLSYIERKIYQKLWVKLSNKIFFSKNHHLRKLSIQDHMRRYSLLSEISSFQANYFFNCFQQIIVFIFSVSLLLYLNLLLSIIALISSIVVFIISLYYLYIKELKYKKILNSGLEYNTRGVDYMFNFLNLKINKQYLNTMYEHSMKKFINEQQSYVKTDLQNNLFNTLIVGLSPLLIIYFSINKIATQEMSMGSLVLYLSMYSYLINSITFFAGFITNISQYKINKDMVNFILNFKDENIVQNGINLNKINKISINNTEFEYETNKSIFKIALFESSKSFKVKGSNGSGKSTLLNILTNTEEYKGSIKINDIELNQYDKNNYWKSVYYNNNDEVVPSIKVIDYITELSQEKRTELLINLEKFKLYELLNNAKIDLNSLIKTNASNLSSGQIAIIKLLKLFSKKYPLILLDEAFDNLNNSNIVLLIDAIKKYQSDSFFIEISHQNNFVSNDSKELCLD